MNLFLNKANKGFTLIELLVGFIVGTIMAAAIYFSYTVFSSSYQAIVEKTSVNRALRAAMNEITLNVRKAGYVDPNQFNPSVVRWSLQWTGNINGKTYNYNDGSKRIHGSPIIYFSGGSVAPDALAIYFDEDPLNIRYISYMARVESDGIRYLLRTEYKCLPETFGRPGCTNWDNEKIFSNLETIKFTFFDKYGNQLPVSAANRGTALFTTWTGAITASVDPLLVNYVQISIIFKSQNEIYKNNQPKTFIAGGQSFSYNDKYYREILTASVYPRNIITSK
jgi:prepilin-type N-terminal cleavage/methylation domain-containing protein